ncbi:MAG: galactokinase, partial [Chitinophagaceae bacterium]
LFNTNVKHALASSEYNTRRNECLQAVEWVRQFMPSVSSLRDVTESMLDQYVKPKNELIDKRSRFVVQEIKRLLNGCEDLGKGDVQALGKKMLKTHEGLSKMYEVSCKELDWLVDFVKGNPNVMGARMMGGGFGGCTINLVREDAIDALIESIIPAYEEAMHLPLSYYIASIENGTERIK